MMTLKKFFRFSKFTVFFSLVMLTILLVSCASNYWKEYYRNHMELYFPSVQEGTDYKSSTFSSAKLSNNGLAFLPISTEKDVDVYKQMIGKKFNRKADSTFSNFMNLKNVNEILKKEELVLRFSNEIESYNEVGVLRPSFLRKLANLTDKEYFLFVKLEPYFSEKELDDIQNYLENYNSTKDIDISSIKELGASAIIWGATEGTVVWEGYSKMYLFEEEYEDNRQAKSILTEKITKSLIKNISAR